MCDNDHTDAEFNRREHDHEMGLDEGDRAWHAWTARVEAVLSGRGWDERFEGGPKVGQSRGLDGDENSNGYSIDGAYDAFELNVPVEEYIDAVAGRRYELGFR